MKPSVLCIFLLLVYHLLCVTHAIPSFPPNSTVITAASLKLLEAKIAANPKNQFMRINMSLPDYPTSYHLWFFASNNLAMISALDPYVRSFTFKRILENFIFLDLVLAPEFDAELRREAAEAEKNNTVEDVMKIWSVKIANYFATQTSLGKSKEICFHHSQDELQIEHTIQRDHKPQISFADRIYICCDGSGDCGPVYETPLVLFTKLALHSFRIVACIMLVAFISKRMNFFTRNDDHMKILTNSYYSPPYFLMSSFPVFKKASANIRNWHILGLLALLVSLYVIALFHAITPLTWPGSEPEEELLQVFPIVSREDFWTKEVWVYFFIIYPMLILMNLWSSLMRIVLPRRKVKLETINPVVPVIERIVRIILGILLAAGLGTAWRYLLHYTLVFREYSGWVRNAIHVVFSIGILVYLQTRPMSDFVELTKKILNVVNSRIKKRKGRMLLDDIEAHTDDTEYVQIESRATPSPRSIPYTVNSVVLFYLKYVIPSWTYEAIWLTSTFFLSYTFAAVATRLIWSTLLLFILNPDQVQVYLYLLSLVTTVYKSFVDLNEPYQKLQAFILNKRAVMTTTEIETRNKDAYVASLEVRQNKNYTRQNPVLFYMTMTLELFIYYAELVQVNHFIRAVFFRLFVTTFVLLMFFLGTSLFSTAELLQGSTALKILASSLMPLIPNIVSMIANQANSLDNAVFEARATASLRLLERMHAPLDLPKYVEPQFCVLNTKPPLDDGTHHMVFSAVPLQDISTEEKSQALKQE